MRPARFFDAHLDLAYLAVRGRDMLGPAGLGAAPHAPAAVTLDSLARGRVAACLGTIFTEAGGDHEASYPADDFDAAHQAGVRQLGVYHEWRRRGLVRLLERRGQQAPPGDSLAVAILMECADPIRTPDELEWWVQRGVVAIGLAWARGSRYADGNSAESAARGRGLTSPGRELVGLMDRLGIVHDASHLSRRALDALLELSDAAIVATHSNCAALLRPGDERHLTDGHIVEIARRGGVIGLNLFAPFLRAGLAEGERPPLADAVRHLERLREVIGHDRAIGLGTDMDGGFSAMRLPRGIDSASDLHRLTDALSARGWSDGEVSAVAWGNWARFWGLSSAVEEGEGEGAAAGG